MESDDPTVIAPLLEAVEPTVPKTPSPGSYAYSDRLFREVDCHEYSPGDGGVNFVKGELVFDVENDPCKGEEFDRQFDSKELQMNSHLYYLAGTNDVAAPYEGARYHFENQTASRRNFVIVPGGAHGMFGHVLSDCKDLIWEKILAQEDLTDVIPQCKAAVQLEVR